MEWALGNGMDTDDLPPEQCLDALVDLVTALLERIQRVPIREEYVVLALHRVEEQARDRRTAYKQQMKPP
jgi:hypothetical protein